MSNSALCIAPSPARAGRCSKVLLFMGVAASTLVRRRGHADTRRGARLAKFWSGPQSVFLPNVRASRDTCSEDRIQAAGRLPAGTVDARHTRREDPFVM